MSAVCTRLSLGYLGHRESAELVLTHKLTKIFGDVKWLITTVDDEQLTQITLLHSFGCFHYPYKRNLL